MSIIIEKEKSVIYATSAPNLPESLRFYRVTLQHGSLKQRYTQGMEQR